MSKERVWAIVKYPDGRIVKELVSFKGTEKLEKKITDNYKKKLWLSKTHYKYLDDKNREENT